MEVNTVSARMYGLLVLYDMQTTYFNNALEGISDKDAHERLGTKANHVAWLTGSLVQQRYELANMLGVEGQQVAHELFNNYQGIRDGIHYPPLDGFKKDWGSISPLLREALLNATDETLNRRFEMGRATMTYFDLIAFCTYREANCIGQIALYRRLLGYEAMKYDD